MNMTARLLTLLALVCCSLTAADAQAQILPKVGLNISGLDAELEDYDAEARTGWNAGVDLRVGRGFFFVQPGAHYYSFTARLIDHQMDPNNVDFEEETTIQSVRAPLNAGIRLLGNNKLLQVNAFGGVTPAYVLNVDEKPGYDLSVDDLNRFTMGANIGASVDLLFLTASLTYEKGLTQFFQHTEGKNNITTLSVGLRF